MHSSKALARGSEFVVGRSVLGLRLEAGGFSWRSHYPADDQSAENGLALFPSPA